MNRFSAVGEGRPVGRRNRTPTRLGDQKRHRQYRPVLCTETPDGGGTPLRSKRSTPRADALRRVRTGASGGSPLPKATSSSLSPNRTTGQSGNSDDVGAVLGPSLDESASQTGSDGHVPSSGSPYAPAAGFSQQRSYRFLRCYGTSLFLRWSRSDCGNHQIGAQDSGPTRRPEKVV